MVSNLLCSPTQDLLTDGTKLRRAKDSPLLARFMQVGSFHRIFSVSRNIASSVGRRWRTPYDSWMGITGAAMQMTCWQCCGHGNAPTSVQMTDSTGISQERSV